MASNFRNPNVTVGTTLTDLYTTPAATESVMFSLNITNKNLTTARTISIKVFDSSGTVTRTIVDSLEIPALDSFLYPDKIVLAAADKLQVIVDAGTDVDALASVLEKS